MFLVRGRTRSVSEIKQLKTLIINSLNSSYNIDSEPPLDSPELVSNIEQRLEEKVEEVTQPEPWLSNTTTVTIWIDLPNVFPWRNCLQEWGGSITPSDCQPKGTMFKLEPVVGEGKRFVWRTMSGRCVAGVNGKVSVRECKEEDEGWLWTESGQFQWQGGSGGCPQCRKCATSTSKGAALELKFCEEVREDQNLELGAWQGSTLAPLEEGEWRVRQERMRDRILSSEKVVVRKALEEVDTDNSLHEFDKPAGKQRRRAAVFYLDKGHGGITMAKWWIFTWRFIGLDTAAQGFDLVFMTHPANVRNLPPECSLVSDSFSLNWTSPGNCLYKPYLGIAYRDKSYDPYMNSQECLYGPGSEFLSQYSILLRADLDTFPAPR